MVTGTLVKQKNKIVQDLKNYLYNTPDDSSGQGNKLKKQVLTIMALDGIGTRHSLQVLLQAAIEHPEIEVRAHILKSLSLSHSRAPGKDSAYTDSRIVQVLAANLDDTTMAVSLGERIQDIAREGLKNWTGTDYTSVNTVQDRLPGGLGNTIGEKMLKGSELLQAKQLQ
ncbi:MAG: hypothetical protein LWX56_04980 [Ignavibacteria bacterium]|nr:hypothetical protein [Ignavibacteria bacterium]